MNIVPAGQCRDCSEPLIARATWHRDRPCQGRPDFPWWQVARDGVLLLFVAALFIALCAR